MPLKIIRIPNTKTLKRKRQRRKNTEKHLPPKQLEFDRYFLNKYFDTFSVDLTPRTQFANNFDPDTFIHFFWNSFLIWSNAIDHYMRFSIFIFNVCKSVREWCNLRIISTLFFSVSRVLFLSLFPSIRIGLY